MEVYYLLIAAVIVIIVLALKLREKNNSGVYKQHLIDIYSWLANDPETHPQSDFLEMIKKKYNYVPVGKREEDIFYGVLKEYQKGMALSIKNLRESSGQYTSKCMEESIEGVFFYDSLESFSYFLSKFESFQYDSFAGYNLMSFTRHGEDYHNYYDLTEDGILLYHLVISVCGINRSHSGLMKLDECVKAKTFDIYDKQKWDDIARREAAERESKRNS